MDRLMLKPMEVAEAIGISRARCYELLAAGTLPSIRLGGSIRVPVTALNAWISQQLTEQQANAGR